MDRSITAHGVLAPLGAPPGRLHRNPGLCQAGQPFNTLFAHIEAALRLIAAARKYGEG